MGRNNLVVEREKLQFTMSRDFDAPRELVWKACTDSTLIPNWWGPAYYTTVVEQNELAVGGAWRFIQTDAQGNRHVFYGVYQEVRQPEKLAYTFEYEPYAGHVSVDAITFEELPGGKTRLTAVTTFTTLEDLEGMLQSGMEEGAVEGWDRLEALAASLMRV